MRINSIVLHCAYFYKGIWEKKASLMNSKDGSDLTWTPNPAPAEGQDVAQPDADATVSSGPGRRQ